MNLISNLTRIREFRSSQKVAIIRFLRITPRVAITTPSTTPPTTDKLKNSKNLPKEIDQSRQSLKLRRSNLCKRAATRLLELFKREGLHRWHRMNGWCIRWWMIRKLPGKQIRSYLLVDELRRVVRAFSIALSKKSWKNASKETISSFSDTMLTKRLLQAITILSKTRFVLRKWSKSRRERSMRRLMHSKKTCPSSGLMLKNLTAFKISFRLWRATWSRLLWIVLHLQHTVSKLRPPWSTSSSTKNFKEGSFEKGC